MAASRRCLCVLLLSALLSAARCSHPDDDPLADEDGLPDALGDDNDRSFQQQESRNLRPRAFPNSAYNALPTGGGYRPAPSAAPSASLQELAGYTRPSKHQQKQKLTEEEEEEREEPDRLAQLLQQSRFDCNSKPGGYYADTELACEVFHYCQEGVKHSWICPDGFTFHQVHLICMPPTHDNSCQQSSQYSGIVNDHLYRAVNEEEKVRRPDLPLKYADRYYPDEVYHDDRRQYDEDDEPPRPRPAALKQQHQNVPQAQSPRPQVFRSAEEVNIPLGQRRPQRPYEFDF